MYDHFSWQSRRCFAVTSWKLQAKVNMNIQIRFFLVIFSAKTFDISISTMLKAQYNDFTPSHLYWRYNKRIYVQFMQIRLMPHAFFPRMVCNCREINLNCGHFMKELLKIFDWTESVHYAFIITNLETKYNHFQMLQ